MNAIPELTIAGGYWTTNWYDDGGTRRWRRFGNVKKVSRVEAAKKFRDFLRAWIDDDTVRNPDGTDSKELTIEELAARYDAHARIYYRKRASGRETREAANVASAMRYAVVAFGDKLAEEFIPADLVACRKAMIPTCARKTINAMVHRIRRVFQWGVEQGLVPAETWHGLQAVTPLKFGRTEARETEPVTSVFGIYIAAVLAAAPSILRAMIRLQLLTGMRPGEVCIMRPCDIDVSEDVWVYTPFEHKTEHHGRRRRVFLGPRAQQILVPFLKRPANAFCFSPREAMAERWAACKTHRQTPNTERKTDRKIRDRYDTKTYRRAITRICQALGIPKWTPGRLRHNRATDLFDRRETDAARVTLGQADSATTEIYIDTDVKQIRDEEAARRIAMELG